MSEDWTPKTDGPLDEQITDVLENLEDTVKGHWPVREITFSVFFGEKLLRLRVEGRSLTNPNVSKFLDHVVDRVILKEVERKPDGTRLSDPLALAVLEMIREIEVGSEAT